MLFNLKRVINTKLFDFFVKDVLTLPMVNCDNNSSVVIVSQLCSRDLIMYLVAIKSFAKHILPLKVIVVGDKLTRQDMLTLKIHISNIEIINIQDVDTDSFPKGGCWERLLTILDVSKFHYTVQLDADTITFSMPEEVRECVANNRSFTLGTEMGQNVISFQEATRQLRDQNINSQHVQVLAELSMAEIDPEDKMKYIRGCAAFAGFAKGSMTREKIKHLALTIEHMIGESKWKEWGSEQVASNFAVANSEKPMVLPVTKYHYYKPGIDEEQFSLLHFVGSTRFTNGKYVKLARNQVKLLGSSF